MVEKLTQHFGKRDPPATVRRKLGELRQGREVSAEFAEEVRRLITLAYPGVDLQLQDQLATDVFLKGLRNQKVAYEVMNRDPCSLIEAQKFVRICEDPITTSCRVQTPRYVTADQFTALMDEMKTLVHRVKNLQLQGEHLQSTCSEHQHSKAAMQLSVPSECAPIPQAQIVEQLAHILNVVNQGTLGGSV